ncbi:acyltransferase [Azospirillum brasilense]|uniref:Acyltransferase n=1 Tax=Azospirillum brasilense TaxID=192 RepID=A0A235H557_AZOBR|nr:acyltransferase [Azospirillum brasilense]OYD80919.1 hypothetical protein CHT98_28865 [Azospirillum brasilense]
MSVNIIDNGSHNRFEIASGFLENNNGTIIIRGDQNVITIKSGCSAKEIFWEIGSNCSVTIDERVQLSALNIYALNGSNIKIGKGTGFTWRTTLQAHESEDINIGDDCLFASDTRISVSDMHSIIDRTSGERINPAKSVCLEDHVWVSDGVLILKGVKIGTGSAIGARAVVSRDIPPYSLAVGVPAKPVKSNITWMRELI